LAKKRKQPEIRKPVTTRQLTRKEREKKTQRIVLIISLIVVVIAIGFAVYGIYDSQYRPYNETVMEVNGNKVDMNYYLNMLKAYLYGAESTQVASIANSVPDAIANNIVIIERAPDLGFTVPVEEIDNAIKEGRMPNEQSFRDLYASSVLNERLRNEYFGAQIPETADQVKVMAMVVNSEEMADSVMDGLSRGQPFFDFVKKFGVERISNENSGNLGWLVKGMITRLLGYEDPSVLEETAFAMQQGEVSPPVYDPNIVKDSGYWILKVIERDGPDSCRASGILLSSAEEAEEIKQRLEDGEDFSALAKEYSQDENSKDDGGDLGWLRRGYTGLVIEQVFDMDEGEVRGPLHDATVQTKGGYWIIQAVENVPDRLLDEETREQLINEDFLKWINEQRASSTINKYLTEEQQQWAMDQAVPVSNIKGK
jgi:parvulin-like peptidyl-prolyl isomerase